MNIDYPLKESLIYRRKAINALAGDDALYSDSFSGITAWRSDPSKQPTEEQIQAKLAEFQTEHDSKQYQRDRAVAYPSIQDQLDKIYHSGLTAWKADIKAVKDKYPKP